MTVDEHGRLTSDPRYPDWADWTGAVLLSNEISYYAADPSIPLAQRLIEPFEEQHLEAARYNLRLGSDYRMQDQAYVLSDKQPWLSLQPHQMALVETLEDVRLPRFLIARWNLKVPKVYEGLLWVGALQVDPGWHGHLSCPIYNMSDREVRLKYRDELFVMDFVRTTPFRSESSKSYVQKAAVGQSGSVHTYDRVGLRSGPYELIGKVESMENEVRQLEARFGTSLGILIALVTLIVAAGAAFLAVSAKNAGGFDLPGLSTGDVALILASVATVAWVVSLIYLWLSRPRKSREESERPRG